MLILEYLPGLRSLIRLYKLPGFNPYNWNANGESLESSKSRRRLLGHKIAMGINLLYCVSMSTRILTKSFEFSMTILSVAFILAFGFLLLVRQNWSGSDQYLDCINCIMRFERVLMNKERYAVPVTAKACKLERI
jgi:hypothetical protein